MLDDLEEAQDSVEMGSGYLMCLVETNHNDKKTSDKVKRTFGLVASIFVIKLPVDTVLQSFSCCLYWILEKKCLIQMNKNNPDGCQEGGCAKFIKPKNKTLLWASLMIRKIQSKSLHVQSASHYLGDCSVYYA